MTYYYQNYIFMEFKLKLDHGLSGTLMADNEEQKLSLLIESITHARSRLL